ncbi:MAG TPA: hypothetical protein VK911_00285 [Vicinamibacterales bacterium]|nr:hypothetical protein [Vicinamibacterales bacterium]
MQSLRLGVFLAFLATAAPVAAQARTDKLALLFQEVFGPTGLAVNSEAVLPDGSTHSAHFNSGFQSNFGQINVAIASQLTSLPLPSPAAGFTYTFDTATGTFVRSTQSYGPILTDRAETIGRGRFSFGYNVQFFSFDTLEGLSLSSIPAVFTHDDFQLGGGLADVVTTVNSIEASVGQMTGVLTYGVTERLDVSVAVPLVYTRLSVRSDAVVQRVGTSEDPAIHFFRDADAMGTYGSHRQFSAQGSATGLGDVIVRVKGTAFREGGRGVALGVDVRVPSGDERDLLGSGAVGVKPFAAFSTTWGRLAPHVNLGYQWNGRSVLAGNVKAATAAKLPDHLLFSAGADIGVSDRFSLAVDVLGQRVIDSPRLAPTSFTPQGSSLTFADVTYQNSTFSMAAGSVGFKVKIAQRVLANFNLRFRLTDAGLVDRASPLLGLEYGF